MKSITLNAKSLKDLAFESINSELDEIQSELTKAAKNGQLKIVYENISDAAKVFLTDKGFKIKMHLEPGIEIGKSTKITIHWD